MNFKELFPLQVVINLDSRPDRLEICRDIEFPKLLIDPIRKPGVVISGVDDPFWKGTIGCLVSHYQVLQAALALDTGVFIFEDDLRVLEPEYSRFPELVSPLDAIEKCCEELSNIDFDMFYIGANILKPFYKETPHLGKMSHGQSTVAYGVNRKFVKKLIDIIHIETISSPIDVIYAEKVIPQNNCYVSIPLLVVQRDDYSDIENKNVTYSEYLEPRYWSNFRNYKRGIFDE